MGSSVDATLVAGSSPPKRKRKQWSKEKDAQWSKEEDAHLITLVQKYGENWEILKDNFKYDRTPHQLAHRWGMIKRRHGQNFQGIAESTLSEEMRRMNEVLFNLQGVLTSPFLSGAKIFRLTAQNNSGSVASSTVTEARLPSTLTTIRPSGLSLQTLNRNQNLNSSLESGVTQVSANGDEVEMEVTEANDKKDVSKLNGDDETTINKENLKGEEKNDVTGCLIGVEKPNGWIESSNVKAFGVPEINKKENQTVVQTEIKEKTGL